MTDHPPILTPEQVEATRQHIFALARTHGRAWLMVAPPQPDDSDTQLIAICDSHEAFRQRAAEDAATIARLNEEVAKSKDFRAAFWTVEEVLMRPGEFRAKFQGEGAQLLFMAIAEAFVALGGKNFLEMKVGVVSMSSPDFVLTMQAIKGKTPNEMREEALARAEQAEAALATMTQERDEAHKRLCESLFVLENAAAAMAREPVSEFAESFDLVRQIGEVIREREQAEAALATLQEATTWQPMETAPKAHHKGPTVLGKQLKICVKHGFHHCTGCLSCDAAITLSSLGQMCMACGAKAVGYRSLGADVPVEFFCDEHWMPLPPPPPEEPR